MIDTDLVIREENLVYLKNIEKYVDKYVSKKYSVPSDITTIVKDNLSRLFNNKLTFSVDIIYGTDRIKNMGKNPHFIMAVHPELDDLVGKPTLVDSLAKEHMKDFIDDWKSISSWVIEIEHSIIDAKSNLCVRNGAEFVALLCHELGHVMNTAPFAVYKNFTHMKNRTNRYMKIMLNNPPINIHKLFLPVFTACDSFVMLVHKPFADIKSLHEEIKADSMVPDVYKPYLISYIEEVIFTNPVARNGVIKQWVDYDHDTEEVVNFTGRAIEMLKIRDRSLKVALDYQADSSPSKYISKMCNVISDLVVPKYKGKDLVDVVKESRFYNAIDTMYNDAVCEATAILESSTVTERDIAILQTDIDAIQTVDDKNYVLNTIFDYLEILEAQRDKTIKKIKDVSKIPDEVLNDPKIKQLTDMKKIVMAMKVTNYTGDHYGLFVKYPKGYEG